MRSPVLLMSTVWHLLHLPPVLITFTAYSQDFLRLVDTLFLNDSQHGIVLSWTATATGFLILIQYNNRLVTIRRNVNLPHSPVSCSRCGRTIVRKLELPVSHASSPTATHSITYSFFILDRVV